MTLALDYAARSDRGLVRSNNEDSAVAASHLLALADGMGGHAAGEVASQLMIESLLPLNAAVTEDTTPERLPALLFEATESGNRAIAAHVDENPTLEGMGCTLSSLLFNDGALGLCHVGDSRGYLLRDGVLTQITKDDTFVQSLVDEGKLDPADVSSHPQRSLILKALTGRPVEPTLRLLEAREGDRYLLCSDGLSDPVSADTIRDVLDEGTPDAAAMKLIDLALRGGGPDNVTVVVADVVDAATGTDISTDSDISTNSATDEDATPDDLPAAVILAGAIDSDATELPRPDTAAGRAMSVNVVSSSAAASAGGAGASDRPGPATGRRASGMPAMRRSRRIGQRRPVDAPDGDTVTADPESRQSRRRRRILIAATVIVALVVVTGVGGWLAKRSLNDSYFVAVAAAGDLPNPTSSPSPAAPTTGVAAPSSAVPAPDAPAVTSTAPTRTTVGSVTGSASISPTRDAATTAAAKGTPILIYQGAPGNFLGMSLNSAYQEICLDQDASIRLLPAGSRDSCHRFSTADLTPAARGTLDTLPRDSYESIQDQLRRLSAQTLPICVTRDPGGRDGGDGNTTDDNSATDDRGSGSTGDGDPADLTTPGVSCREVN